MAKTNADVKTKCAGTFIDHRADKLVVDMRFVTITFEPCSLPAAVVLTVMLNTKRQQQAHSGLMPKATHTHVK